jgi:PAS domain S-box-containing protein
VSQSEPVTVLVVDDEPRYADAHARMLPEEYAVQTATDSHAALESIDEDVDVLLLDRDMPGMSGEELAGAVLERDLDPGIVMITATDPDLDILELGVDDYITKPVEQEELRACVEEVLEWSEYDDALRDYFALSNKRDVLLEERGEITDTSEFSAIERRLREAAESGLQKSEELLQTLVQSSPAAIVTLDAAGKVDIWNPTAEAMFGWSRAEVAGEDPPIFTAEARTRMEEVRSTLFNGQDVTDRHLSCTTATHTTIEVSLSGAPLYDGDGEMDGMMFILTDVTERKRREQRLSVFSRVLRHNLRNQLNVVLGHGERLRDSVPEKQRETVETILETVEDLVETSRKVQQLQTALDGDVHDVTVFDTGDLLTAVAVDAREEYSRATVGTDVGPDAPSVVASASLADALWQLVENAVEHNEGGATVRLAVAREAGAERDWTRIQVADDGPGIPDHEIAVLEMDEEDPLKHGRGLGLWTVKWIVDRSGGELAFGESELGGTEARVALPTHEE